MKVELLAYTFFRFPSLPSETNRWCLKLIKWKNNNDECHVSSNTVLYRKISKSHFWDGSCHQVLFPRKTYQVKPLQQNKKENYQEDNKLQLNNTETNSESLTVNYFAFSFTLTYFMKNLRQKMLRDKPITLFLNCWNMTIHFIILW